ncbi:MAG: alanine--tRNA ligase [Candidatus Altiarchaeales archaeon]|nr:alanine--tRNA ligase [Candidatus Altiarchaeales archaeon]
MAFDFREVKKTLKPLFHREYEKYYPTESLRSMGFQRSICVECGRGFWSENRRDVCDEPACSGGYRFIGEKLTKKEYSYREAWEAYVSTFRKWDYVPIKRYPVVCRWYEDLYFVTAGINDFQPYVVAGEVDPPAPAVLEPQFCLRFQDLDSVGVTGRHYTGFIMVGQHTFNTKENHVYFKDEGILQIHEFLTEGLGIASSEIFYHEDIWAGGGNFGPSVEFFSRGLELGNQVYMQYELLADGSHRELKTKVIDMGAGLERWSWFSQGKPMSYDCVFSKTLEYIYGNCPFEVDGDFKETFARYAGLLTLDEVEDINSVWGGISDKLGLSLEQLKRKTYEMRAPYALADHTRSLLVAINDGALPSNVGGGYNLRTLLRRSLSLMDEYEIEIDLKEVLSRHINEFGSWYPEVAETESLWDIIEVEERRYRQSRVKGRRLIQKIQKEGGRITSQRLVELYDSQGITPDLAAQLTGVEVPDNFYQMVEELHQKKDEKIEQGKIKLPDYLPETLKGFYEDQHRLDFSAKIIGVFNSHVVLDKTYFYPTGGGQETDTGFISGRKVLDVVKQGNVILHKVEDASDLPEGEEVECRVDEKRRIQLMQHHTATHIVNAACGDVLGPHIWQAGAHKSEKTSRLDVTHYKAVTEEQLRQIEDKANEYVSESHPVEVSWMRRNEAEEKYGMRLYQGGAVPGVEIRVVNVVGVDVEACGGTHVSNTKDIGRIKILSAKRIQDGVVRFEFKAGGAFEKRLRDEQKIFEETLSAIDIVSIKDKNYSFIKLKKAADTFSVEVEALPQTVERFAKEVKTDRQYLFKHGEHVEGLHAEDLGEASTHLFETWKRQKKALEKYAGEKAGELREELEKNFEGKQVVKKTTENLTVKQLTETAKKVVEKPDRLLILANKDGEKAQLVIASSGSHNAGELCKKLCSLLGGGGGGSPNLAQGGGSSKDLKEVLEDFISQIN